MKIIFFGTPEYVIPILDLLHKEFKTNSGESPIASVVTQKPKPAGREQKLIYSPVDAWAYRRKIPIIFEPQRIVEADIQADLGILASYGEIISDRVINHFLHGILNVHPSLLPKWRGASPVQASIISGEKETGVSIIKLDALLDHGQLVCQFKDEIQVADTTESLRTRLFERSAEVIASLIPPYLSNKINLYEQDHKKATITRQIKKEQGFIPPEYLDKALEGKTLRRRWEIPFVKDYFVKPSPESIERFVRAMNPWPIAWTNIQLRTNNKEQSTKRLKILKAHVENKTVDRSPSAPSLVLDLVQLEGKSPVSWKQFCEGYPNASFEKQG